MNDNICIIGLGYVGLPLSLAFCQKKEIEIYFNKREHRFSSSALRKQV